MDRPPGKSKASRLIEAVGVCLLEVEASGKVAFANGAAGELWACKAEALVGRPLAELADPSEREVFLPNILRRSQSKGRFDGFLRIRRFDGSSLLCAVVLKALSPQGGWALAATDASPFRSREREAREAKRLDLYTRVAEGMAHELLNPLVALAGWAHRLDKDITSGPARRHLDRIISETARLEELVRQIRTFISLPPPSVRPTPPLEVLEGSLGGIEEISAERGVALKVRADRRDPVLAEPTWWVDPDQMEKAVRNLYINGVEAMPDGGELDVGLQADDHHLVWSVNDSGRGIAQENLDNIFNPFFTTKTHGMGLNLTLTLRVVHEHRGHIAVESRLGEGTAFTLTFPRDRRHPMRTRPLVGEGS